jgi:hypothetical protein
MHANAWWDDWGSGYDDLHDFSHRCSSQVISIGEAERFWKAYSNVHNPQRNGLGERVGKLVGVHYSLRLKSKRKDPKSEAEFLPQMELQLDVIDEAADNLEYPSGEDE